MMKREVAEVNRKTRFTHHCEREMLCMLIFVEEQEKESNGGNVNEC